MRFDANRSERRENVETNLVVESKNLRRDLSPIIKRDQMLIIDQHPATSKMPYPQLQVSKEINDIVSKISIPVARPLGYVSPRIKKVERSRQVSARMHINVSEATSPSHTKSNYISTTRHSQESTGKRL